MSQNKKDPALIQYGILCVGFALGLLWGILNWYTSPREFNERNENNRTLEHCIQILESKKTDTYEK